MNRDGSHYLFLLLRYWWLLIGIGGLVAGAAFWWNSNQPDQFLAETQLFIGNALESADPESQQLETSVRLAAVYAELARNYSVLQQTVETLNLDETPEELEERVSASVIGETPFLTISVTYPDPETAAAIANAVADNLLATSINREMDSQVERLLSLQGQIDKLEELIDITNSEYQTALEDLNAARAANNEDIIDQQTSRVASLTDQLNNAYSALSELTREYLTLSNSTNRVEIVEEARPNNEPQGLGSAITGAAGLIFGVMVAGIVVVGVDALDNRVRSESQIRRMTDSTFLGRIPRLRLSRRRYMKLLQSGDLANQNFGEVYRSIVSDLIFSGTGSEQPVDFTGKDETIPYPRARTFVIASPRHKEGRTFTAMNLAVMSASYGLRTLLIDADLRNPSVGEYFQSVKTVQDRITELLQYLSDRPIKLQNDYNLVEELKSLLIRSGQGYENLSVIRGDIGFSEVTSSTTTLLTLNQLRRYINLMTDIMHFDIIIADTPPLLTSNDSVNLTTHLNAEVVLLLQSGNTRIPDAQKAIELLERRHVPVQGVILNRT